MLILPAIDLIEGRCVRLLHGNFDHATRYGDPIARIASFAEAGATWVHVVDLDGARAGCPRQTELIGSLTRAANVRIQSGGGVRTREHIQQLLDQGVARVVLGSIAARAPDLVRTWLHEFGSEAICCAFDVRRHGCSYEVTTEAWREGSGMDLDALLDAYAGNLAHVLVTDISRDGAMTGPNIDLIKTLVAAHPGLQVQASGGVSSLADLGALRNTGAAGAIVGRALYERAFTLEDALAG